jgi:hypothetical protein
LIASIVFVPALLRAYRTTDRRDFEAEWLSARNFFNDVPVYEPRDVSLQRYLGDGPAPHGVPGGETNPHPPSSILLSLPLGLMPYADAFLVWNAISHAALIASLMLIFRGLAIPWTATNVVRTYTLSLLCGPLNAQIYQGQLNLVLLALIVGAWAADREDRPAAAGILLGAATAIKLFPGVVFVFFVFQRRWRSVASGIAAVAVLTLVTAATLGAASYRDYFATSAHTIAEWRSAWGNLSVYGFWSKLFDPASRLAAGMVTPLSRSPRLAAGGALVCDGLLISAVSRFAATARSRSEQDVAFSLTVVVALLVSPVLWSHYFVLLLLPVLVLWTTLPAAGPARWDLWLIVFVLWINPELWWSLFVPRYAELRGRLLLTPWQTVTGLSIPMYAVVGLFLLGASVRPVTLVEDRRSVGVS